MTGSRALKARDGRKYELVPPEGGWGYVVTLSISMFFSVTVVPVCVFGQLFGGFLRSIGDETYGTTLANGVFNMVLSFTGIAANYLLQVYSCRKVGLIGAGLFFCGALGTAFVNSLFQMIITFGVLQGFGFGLLMPAGFTAFNGYFEKRQNVMMSCAQALIVGITMAWPAFTEKLMGEYGWRGTQAIFAALSLHCFVAMLSLQPVKWHMKRKYLSNVELNAVAEESERPLIDGKANLPGHQAMQGHLKDILEKPRKTSVISIGSMAVSVTNLDDVGIEEAKRKGIFQTIYESMDLELFKQATFVNIAIGLSLSLTADLNFLSLLPMILKNSNFGASDTTLILTVYFGSDLVCRILLSVVSAFLSLRNRYLFLVGTLLSAFFRTAFLMGDSLLWVCGTCSALGFLRCLIQTPLPLVVAEQYGQRFSTAFTLYMVTSGVIFAIFAPLIGYVRQATQSDEMVVHLLTAAYLLCGIPWTIELMFKKCSNK